MEQANQITLKEPNGLSGRHAQCWKVLVQELTKCAVHCRQELTKADVLVYFESLKDSQPEALRNAIRKCRESLPYIPKIHEIKNSYDPVRPATYADLGPVVDEWVEDGMVWQRREKHEPWQRQFVRMAGNNETARLARAVEYSDRKSESSR